MRIEILVLGALQTNCYLVFNEETKKGFIIDPAADALKITAALNRLEIEPEAVLLTHGHFDHMMAAEELRVRYGIPVYAHRMEQELLGDARKNLSAYWADAMTLEADHMIEDGQELTIAGIMMRVIHTPGHTKGGVCYYMEQEEVLIAGDTLFCESYGRTDFPGGSVRELFASLRGKLFVLPDSVIAYPGHGQETNIGYEKRYNPAAGGRF